MGCSVGGVEIQANECDIKTCPYLPRVTFTGLTLTPLRLVPNAHSVSPSTSQWAGKDIRSSLLGLGLLETTAVHTYLVLLSRRSVKLALHFPPDHNSKEGTMSNQSICGRGAIVIVDLSRTRARYINRWANISEQALRVQRRSLRLYLQVSCEVLYMPRVERESRLEH